MREVTKDHIDQAQKAIASAVRLTSCEYSRTLSKIFGSDIWLKFENLQFTGAFKERGALNRLLKLTKEERARGVIAMSAGNHAQGVSYHAKRLGVPATIVMPKGTPIVKVENTEAHGARVLLEGETLEEAAKFSEKFGRDEDLMFVHPYDDPDVIAGQGTIGLEMLAQVPDLDCIVVPIGGGGLISGIAIAAKAIKPDIEIIGVQSKLYPSMFNHIKNQELPSRGDTLAEGIAVKAPGRLTAPLVEKYVDDIVLVSEAELEHAVALYINIEKTVVEGAGAAGLAAVVSARQRFENKKVGLILCGGNIDTRLLSSVLTREQARAGRLSQLTLDLPDRPGQLAKVSAVVGNAGANILEVYHQRVFTDLPAKGAELHLVVETRDRAHRDSVVERLRGEGYPVVVKGGLGHRLSD